MPLARIINELSPLAPLQSLQAKPGTSSRLVQNASMHVASNGTSDVVAQQLEQQREQVHQLEHALSLVSGLLNALLARQLIEEADRAALELPPDDVDSRPAISLVSAALMGFASFVLGALGALGAVGCLRWRVVRQAATHEGGARGSTATGATKLDVEISISGTQHNVPPPAHLLEKC